MTKKVEIKVVEKRFKKSDRDRLIKKVVSSRVGKYDLSESSADAAYKIIHGYDEQVSEDNRIAGSHPKRREGIWQAALEILESNPKISLDDTWAKLDGFEIGYRWSFRRDGDDMVQEDHNRKKGRSRVASIKKNTFRTQYFYPARKKINWADK